MHYLHRSNAGFPFHLLQQEVALHALINNKCAAQRVGTGGKSKHKEEPSRTA